MAEHGGQSEPLEESGATAGTPVTADTSATALAVALAKRRSGRTDARLDDFLEKQTRMLELQMEHLHEQRGLQVEHLKHQEKHLRLRYFGDRLRIGLQLLGILFGVAVAVALGAMAWNAHEDHGVSIEAFAVPPDLAQRGLTGQVVASQLLDKLADLQAATVTARPASTYANDWGGDIKVEIPETGVSIGELNRYLREWLGSQTRITGEVIRTPGGLAVTARAGAAAGRTYAGPEANLDQLIQQAAGSVYAHTQPYRWAVYLASTGRRSEAMAAFARIAASGAAQDRPWAYAGWSTVLIQAGEPEAAAEKARTALRLDPNLIPASPALLQSESNLDHQQAVLLELRRLEKVLGSGRAVGISHEAIPGMMAGAEGGIAGLQGDYLGAVRAWTAASRVDIEGLSGLVLPVIAISDALMNVHEVREAERLFATSGGPQNTDVALQFRVGRALVLEDFAEVIAATDGEVAQNPRMRRLVWPTRATALAERGRSAEALALIDRTPLDCDSCLAARGRIAALRADLQGANEWFGRAAAGSELLPLAYLEWGRALLTLGRPEEAIAKLAQAHRRGPRFADPLELWGEALMAMGEDIGAIAKFAEADKYAPRWGKNHLRWGEALMMSGRYAEARRQYEIANGLDLSRPDRAALNVLLARTARGPLHG